MLGIAKKKPARARKRNGKNQINCCVIALLWKQLISLAVGIETLVAINDELMNRLQINVAGKEHIEIDKCKRNE
jgi:hypothetical protein